MWWVNCLKDHKKLSICPLGFTPFAPSVRCLRQESISVSQCFLKEDNYRTISKTPKRFYKTSLTSFATTPWLFANWSAKIARYLSHCCIGLDTSDSSRSTNPTWIKWSRVWSAIQASFLDLAETNALTALHQISLWRDKSFGWRVHHSGSEWDNARCFNYERVSRLWSRHSHQLHLGRWPIPLRFGVGIKLTNTVAKHSRQVTKDKTRRMNGEWSHVWSSEWWEECGIQWYDDLTFICFCRCLPLWAKPDTSVSNITQWPGSLCHLVHHDYES